MKLFISEVVHDKEIVDTVFEASQGAIDASKKYGPENVVNGAFGTYFDETGKLLTFDTVYRTFDKIDDITKARYAPSIMGSPDFQEAVKDWLFKSVGLDIDCDVIATPGGTGALSSTIKNTLVPGQTVIHPDIGWGPYTTIAKEQRTPIETYTLFDENDQFNITSFKEVCTKVMQEQGKVLVFINDPCQNPTGYTMTEDEWTQVLDVAKELSEKGAFILLHDIAYIDFNLTGDDYKKIFQRFVGLPENILTVVSFSISKTLSAYGMRVGAQVLISSNEKQRLKLRNACGNTARGYWSTVNTGGMKLFSDIALNKELKATYLKEKNFYVDLLKERAEIFVKEANEVGLPIYPYKEGFFVTIRIDRQVIKNELHLKLKTLNIFFVNVYGGLRVAICSIPKDKTYGLAKRVKDALDELLETRE
ncbi:MAG: pyridoxal phosphate-dependent aminotransferase [Candidatus Izemoplasmataceae bacterium]|jgi:aspartate/tyrosine/aromatic aminotransferase|uniref:pyridoxal phosphate-dependent aminotransferase n=1 Tax=Liberiplasma polymorphum TaxID=3374570 RepID=UPI00377246F2